MALQKASTMTLSLTGSRGLRISDFLNAHSMALSGLHLHHFKHAAATMRTRTYALQVQLLEKNKRDCNAAPVGNTSVVQRRFKTASEQTSICD